jgi:hypothetical protein
MKPIARNLLVALFVGIAVPPSAQPQRLSAPQQSPALRVGDQAPDFKLKTKDGQREAQLSSFKGQKPVVLVFGSFT